MACPRGYRIEKQAKKAGNDFVTGDLLTLFGNKSLHRSLLIRCHRQLIGFDADGA